MEKQTTNWENLHQTRCPKCGANLKFRHKLAKINMKVRGFSGTNNRDDYYFCTARGCADFQITKKRLIQMQKEMISSIPKPVQDIFSEMMGKIMKKEQR